jgi:hypothetical protein
VSHRWTPETAKAAAIRSHLRRNPEQQRQHSREGGIASGVVRQRAVIERYAGLSRDEAILQARRDALVSTKHARYQQRKRGQG